MDPTLNVVLPVHNQERSLSSLIRNILELAIGVRRQVRIIVIDDASTDDTFDTACELATSFPQVQVLRQPARRGLAAALDRLSCEFGVTAAIVHDGASTVDLGELAALLNESMTTAATSPKCDDPAAGSRRFASMSELSERMQQAHRSVTSFHWMRVHEDSAQAASRRTAPRPTWICVDQPAGGSRSAGTDTTAIAR